jgi:translocation and assembly module TamB
MNTQLPSPESESPPERSVGRSVLKGMAWLGGILVPLLLLVLISATVALHSTRFHNYVIHAAEKSASDTFGTAVHLQNFTLNLSTLSLDIYGLTINGAAPYPNPPVLQVQHAHAGVRIVSILHRRWYLDSVIIDRPVAKVFTDAHGVSNIPVPKSRGQSSSNTSLFDLGIRHAVLDGGEVYYNNQQSVLAADLHDVDFRASFDSLRQKYSGTLLYSDGHLVSGTFQPLPHSLQASFDATPTTFHLTHATLRSDTSSIVLEATVENYRSPRVQAQYSAVVDAGQVRRILKNSSIPTGLLRAAGTLQYQQTTGRPPLDSIVLQGDLNSQRLDIKSGSSSTAVGNLIAHYNLQNGNATLQDLRAQFLGGSVAASGTMTAIGGDSHSSVKASFKGVSLADIRRVFAGSSLPKNITLGGSLGAEATATWGKTLDDLVAHADATIDGHVTGTASIASTANTIPLNSAIHTFYYAKDGEIALSKSYLRTRQTSITINGVIGNRSSLDLRLQADDLREVDTIASLFRQPVPGKPLQPLGLEGTAQFQGTLQGSTAEPHLIGQLTALNLHASGTAWKVIRTGVDISPSSASLQHAYLEPAARGRITLDASAGLRKWSFTDASPIQINLDVSQLEVADLAKLSGRIIPVTGTLTANVKLHGTELNPIGQGSVSLANLIAYDQPFRSAKFDLAGTGDEAHGKLSIQLAAGDIQGDISVRPQQRTYIAQLASSGIRLDALQILKARNIDATGTLAISASGRGSFDNPGLDATLQIPQLIVQNQKITALNLHVDVANHSANANLTSSAVNTSIQAKAKINLTDNYLADMTIDTQAIPLQPLLAVYAPDQAADISGQTEVHATLHGPLKDMKHVEAHVIVPVLKLGYSNTIQLAAASPIHIDYRNGVVDLQRAAIHGTDTDLQLQGSIPTIGNEPMSLLLLGTVNLQLAQLFEPDIRTSGELKFKINSYGAANGPNLGGEIDIVDANYASGDLPVGLSHGNGVLTLTKDRININSFKGMIGGGTLTAQGGVAYRPNVQFDLGLTANGVRLLYPQGMRESVDASVRLVGTTDDAQLGGSINLSELSFTPAFDLTNFISQLSGGVPTPPTPGLAQNIRLNLAVHSINDINLVSRTVSVGGNANLQVRGTASDPVILGRVNLNSGDVILNGSRFVLNGGTVEFVNPSETEPVVNLSLNTTIQEYNIFMKFNGPVDQLRTSYSSDPALPSADIINLLAFGQTTEANSANPSTPANQAAESLIASQVSSQVTSRISKVAGISQLSINPILAGGSSQGPPGANITIQQRVTGNLFVTYSSNVASTQSQTIQGQYQVTPRFAVSATRDQNGGFAVDTIIKKTW